MLRFLSMRGSISPLTYAVVAPLFILSQHGFVALIFALRREPLDADVLFWLFPFNRLVELPSLDPIPAAFMFAAWLGITWALTVLSFRRGAYSEGGHLLAALTIVPGLQLFFVAMLALMPRDEATMADDAERPDSIAHTAQGLLAGVAIIVFAVLVSAVTFGAYGWGLFVLTPLIVGMTTAYIVNRDSDFGFGPTVGVVMWSVSLGCLALIMFALEGFICILLAAPLGALAAVAGAGIGYAVASAGHMRGKPLFVVAILPAAFAFEAAMPPSVSISTHQSIEIAASPAAVWQALISEEPVAAPAGLVGSAGLAYPIRSRLLGAGRGATRLGEFSTGVARERITEWQPGQALAFEVLGQPPAMEEMSPYRRVHAPHVDGYFTTAGTYFELDALPGGGTRLTIRASHLLRIDPVLYWEPIARWAISENTRRVLRDISDKANRIELAGSAPLVGARPARSAPLAHP